MNVKELFCILNEYAPLNLSKELCEIEEGYDNSGIILDSSRQTDKVLFCLDLTSKSVEKAIELGCGIIVTHHPAIYRPIKNLTSDAPLLKCASEKIGVISMHLNLDCAKEGIDYYLAKGLGGEVVKILTPLSVEGTGYGRISEVNATASEILIILLAKDSIPCLRKTAGARAPWRYLSRPCCTAFPHPAKHPAASSAVKAAPIHDFALVLIVVTLLSLHRKRDPSGSCFSSCFA